MRRLVKDSATRDRLVAELRASGWSILDRLAPPDEPFDLSAERLVCTGTVRSAEDLETVLLAAARGAAVVVVDELADPVHSETLAAALEDLDSPAITELSNSASDDRSPRPSGGDTDRLQDVDPLAAALLDRLAAGDPVAAAARSVHLSLRTAHRKVAAARAHYRVSSTQEAVLEHVRARSAQPDR